MTKVATIKNVGSGIFTLAEPRILTVGKNGMNNNLEVANPVARIMTTLEGGQEIFVGIQYQWNGGKLQNQMKDNEWYPEGTLKYVPLTASAAAA